MTGVKRINLFRAALWAVAVSLVATLSLMLGVSHVGAVTFSPPATCPTSGPGVTCISPQYFASTTSSCYDRPTCAANQRVDCDSGQCVCYTPDYPCSGCTAPQTTLNATCVSGSVTDADPECARDSKYTGQCGGWACPSNMSLCPDPQPGYPGGYCVLNLDCPDGMTFNVCAGTCTTPFVLLDPEEPTYSPQTDADIALSGAFTLASGNMTLGDGDLQIANLRSIAVNDSTNPTTLNVGNWGWAGFTMDVYGKVLGDTLAVGSGGFFCIDADCIDSWSGVFPAGTANQTLRHNGTTWEASSALYNDGSAVGINNTNPQEALDVFGNIRLSEGGYIDTGQLSNYDLYIGDRMNKSQYGNLWVKGSENGTSSGLRVYPREQTGWSTPTEYVHLGYNGTNNYGVIGTESMQETMVLRGGNVGIGTNDPMTRFMVNDGVSDVPVAVYGSAVGSQVLFGAGGVARGRIGWTSVGDDGMAFLDSTGATVNMLVTDAGNVGIGNTSPAYKLDVGGDINASGRICIDGDCVTSWDPLYPPGISDGDTLRYNGTMWVANTNIYNNGVNVGIGKTDPAYKLDVNGTVSATSFRMTSSPGAGLVLTSDASGNATWQPAGLSGSGTLNYIPKFTPDGTTLGDSIMYDDGTGKVGVGNSSPGFRFDIYSNSATSLPIVNVADTNGSLWTGFRIGRGATPTERWFIGMSDANENLQFRRNSGAYWEFTADGVRTDPRPISGMIGYDTYLGLYSGNAPTATGSANTFVGWATGTSITTGGGDTFVGHGAGSLVTSGNGNTLVGRSAGGQLTTGVANTFIGSYAGSQQGTRNYTVAIGYQAAQMNSRNGGVYIGREAGMYATGNWNTILGENSGNDPANTGFQNTFVGYAAGVNNTTGSNNVYIGIQSGKMATIAGKNVLIGADAGTATTTGGSNIFLGYRAGDQNTTGSGNIMIGEEANALSAGSNSRLNIGDTIYGDLANARVGIGTTDTSKYVLNVNGMANMTGFRMSTGGGTGYVLTSNANSEGVWSDSLSISSLTLSSLQLTTGATDGYVLTSDASGNASWQLSAGTGAIMGGGTQNYVSKFTPDGTTIGDSIIYDDGARIGVSTPSPGFKLDVQSSTTDPLPIINIKDNGAMDWTGVRLAREEAQEEKWFIGMDDAESWDFLRIRGNSAYNVFSAAIEGSAGYVGIGTNVPPAWDTAFGGYFPPDWIPNMALALGGYLVTDFWRGTTTNTILGYNAASDGGIRSSNVAEYNTIIGYNAGQKLTTGWNNTLLGVDAGRDLTTSSENIMIGMGAGRACTGGGCENNIMIGSSAGRLSTSGINQILIGWDVQATPLSTDDYLNIGNVIFSTLDNGRVGIGAGKQTPAYALDLNGTANVSGFRMTTGAGPGLVLTSDASGNASWQAAAGGGGTVGGSGTLNYVAKFTPDGSSVGDSVMYDDGSKVGIGTPSPGYRLDVRSSASGSLPIVNLADTNGSLWTGMRLARGATPEEKWFVGMNDYEDNLHIRHNDTATSTAWNMMSFRDGGRYIEIGQDFDQPYEPTILLNGKIEMNTTEQSQPFYLNNNTSGKTSIYGLDIDVSRSGSRQTHGIDVSISNSTPYNASLSQYGGKAIYVTPRSTAADAVTYGLMIEMSNSTTPERTTAIYASASNASTAAYGLLVGPANGTGSLTYRSVFRHNLGIGGFGDTDPPQTLLHTRTGNDSFVYNGVKNVMRLEQTISTSVDGQAGMGVGLDFWLRNASGGSRIQHEAAQIVGMWDDPTDGSEDGALSFRVMRNGTSTETVKVTSSGLKLPINATSGYVLTSDASGNASWQAAAGGGGTVGGSGTLNYVAKFTPDGSTLGNSIIYDDGTHVGIGVTSINNAALHVKRGAEAEAGVHPSTVAVFQNSGDSYVQISGSGTRALLFGESGALGGQVNRGQIGYSSTDGFTIYSYRAADVIAMRIQTDGDIGIGTTSPRGRLHVSDNAWPPMVSERTTTGTNSELGTAMMKVTTSGDMVNGFGGGIYWAIQDNSGVENLIGAVGVQRDGGDNYGSIYFNTYFGGGENTRMWIDTNGDVGIGDTTPSYKLDVNGDARFMSGIATNGETPSSTYGIKARGSTSGGYFYNSSYGSSVNAAYLDYGIYTGYKSYFGGDVGIGTSVPDFKLDVNGNVGINDYIYHNGDTDTYTYFSTDQWKVRAGGVDLITAYEGTQDYVRIGTEAGDDDLYVEGPMLITYEEGQSGPTGAVIAARMHYFFEGSWWYDDQFYFGGTYGLFANSNGYIAGKVGIGEPPDLGTGYRWRVQHRDYTPVRIKRAGTDGNLITWYNDDTYAGAITVSGGTVTYGAFTGSHYAWTDSDIEPGALVSFTGENRTMGDAEEGEVESVYGIVLTSAENDSRVLGSYLMPPDSGDEAPTQHQVMAVGNGTMWVVDEGEDIEVGDFLVSSSTTGHARVDSGEYPVSHVIAMATENVDWSTVSETASDGRKHKKISVVFERFDRPNFSWKIDLEGQLEELDERVGELEKENEELKEKMEVIEARIEQLEWQMLRD